MTIFFDSKNIENQIIIDFNGYLLKVSRKYVIFITIISQYFFHFLVLGNLRYNEGIYLWKPSELF